MKAKKTFKLGEHCIGGIIEAQTDNNNNVIITVKDYDSKKILHNDSFTNEDLLADYLFEMTSSYFTEQIIDWIKTKISLTKHDLWC